MLMFLQAELDRYLFYFPRFNNHDQVQAACGMPVSVSGIAAHAVTRTPPPPICCVRQAMKFATKLRETTQKRMQELQERSSSPWADVTFLESAMEVLLEVTCHAYRPRLSSDSCPCSLMPWYFFLPLLHYSAAVS